MDPILDPADDKTKTRLTLGNKTVSIVHSKDAESMIKSVKTWFKVDPHKFILSYKGLIYVYEINIPKVTTL